MRRVSARHWRVSGLLTCAAIGWALTFFTGVAPTYAAAGARHSCGASSSASAGSSTTRAGSARISLNTAQGVAGTQVVVSGTGWPIGVRVFISVENLTDEQGGVNGTGRLISATVDVYGGFTTPAFGFPYAVCGIRPKGGTTASIVAATDDNSVRAVRPFALAQTPTLTVATPQQLSPLPLGATSIAVAGSDWAPGSSVSLVAAQLATVADADGIQRQTATPLPGAQAIHATADARGAVTANVPIPSGLAPGTAVNLSATAISASYGTLLIILTPDALIPAPVPPSWTLSATRGEPGARLTVTGDHWWPADTISVEYCRVEATQPTSLGTRCNLGPQGFATSGYAAQLGQVVVDASGHFTASVTLPASAKPGTVILQARLLGADERAAIYFASRQFTLIPPGPHAQPFMIGWQDWWPRLLVCGLLLGAALFVLWPRLRRTIRHGPTPVAPARLIALTLEGDDDDE
jgi:hypothetical protein